MKKLISLLLIAVLLANCSSTPSTNTKEKENSAKSMEKTYQVPDFPMEMSKEAVRAKIEEMGGSDEIYIFERGLTISDFPIFGVNMKKIRFSFAHLDKLVSVYMRFDPSDNETVKKKIREIYGEPVKSFRQALLIRMRDDGTPPSPLIDIDIAVENRNEVWHTEKPLSQAWSKEELENFKTNFIHTLEESPTDAKPIKDEEKWQTFFENAWESYFVLYLSDDPNKESSLSFNHHPKLWFEPAQAEK